MTPQLEAFLIIGVCIITFIISLFVIHGALRTYAFGVRKIGLITLFNKKRRDMINNLVRSIHYSPIDWHINNITSDWSTVGMKSSKEKDVMVVFRNNIISTHEWGSGKKELPSVTMTLIERIRLQMCYRFLKKWYKNKHENESVNNFYIASTGFKEL